MISSEIVHQNFPRFRPVAFQWPVFCFYFRARSPLQSLQHLVQGLGPAQDLVQHMFSRTLQVALYFRPLDTNTSGYIQRTV